MKNPNLLWIQCFCRNAAILLPLGLWLLLLADWLLKCSLKPIKVSVCVTVCCLLYLHISIWTCRNCLRMHGMHRLHLLLSICSVRSFVRSLLFSVLSVSGCISSPKMEPTNKYKFFEFSFHNLQHQMGSCVCAATTTSHTLSSIQAEPSFLFRFLLFRVKYSHRTVWLEEEKWRTLNSSTLRRSTAFAVRLSGENGTCQSAHDKI